MISTSGIGVLMACAAIVIGTAAGWVLSLILLPIADRMRWSAQSRAVMYAQLRLLPLATAPLLTGAQVLAFQRFEQSRMESAGPMLVGLALAGVGLAAHALWTGAKCWRFTTSSIATLRASGQQVTVPHWSGRAWALRTFAPVVMVAGVIRPDLFVSWLVLRGCTRDELAAIAAHETGHLRAHDNIVRLLFMMTPGAPLARRLAQALERRWANAIEEAADQYAGRTVGPLELASALTKVARMSPTAPPLAASALIGESSLDRRVRRLIESCDPPRVTRAAWAPLLALVIAGVLLLMPAPSAGLHDLFELLVRSR